MAAAVVWVGWAVAMAAMVAAACAAGAAMGAALGWVADWARARAVGKRAARLLAVPEVARAAGAATAR